MINAQPVSTGQIHKHCSIKCFSWSATIVGAFVGIGLSFLLILFSLAIGLSAFSTTQEGITAFAVGGFLGLAIGVIASMFVTGMIAGVLGRPYCNTCNSGALYGMVAWCLVLVLGILLTGPVAKFISASSGFLTNHTLTIIKSTNDEPASTISITAATPTSAATTVNAEKVANDTGKAAFALFVLFFLGALASCFGGHFGMVCRKGCCPSKETKI